MLIDLVSDLNIQLSFSRNDLNAEFSAIKGYDIINWGVNTVSSENHYLKIHLLDSYSTTKFTMNLSNYNFNECSIYYSVDNLNWKLVKTITSSPQIILGNLQEYFSYIKIVFIGVNGSLKVDTIKIESDDESNYNNYKKEFMKFKKNEIVDFLPGKIYKDSDLKNILNSYLEI
jgi:hypothetical protein